MKAVEVPKDLMDALESAETDPNAQTRVTPTPSLRPTPPPRPTPQPMPVAAPLPLAATATAIPIAARDIPPTRPTPVPVKPHVENKPATATDRPPIGASMTTRRTSPALIIVLIIVILGAGVFALWKFVLDTSSDDAPTKSSMKSTPGSDVAAAPGSATKPPPKVEEPPKAAPPAKAKLSTEPEPPEDLKSPVAGTIDTIEPNDKAVKPGDIIARLAGHKPIEAEITTLAFDVDKRLPGDVAAAEKERDTAKAANNAAGVDAAEKKIDAAKKTLEDKRAQLAAKQTELDKFVVKAASAGKLSAISKPGAQGPHRRSRREDRARAGADRNVRRQGQQARHGRRREAHRRCEARQELRLHGRRSVGRQGQGHVPERSDARRHRGHARHPVSS